MGGTTLHAGIVVQWLKICYYGRQWDFIWCKDTFKAQLNKGPNSTLQVWVYNDL